MIVAPRSGRTPQTLPRRYRPAAHRAISGGHASAGAGRRDCPKITTDVQNTCPARVRPQSTVTYVANRELLSQGRVFLGLSRRLLHAPGHTLWDCHVRLCSLGRGPGRTILAIARLRHPGSGKPRGGIDGVQLDRSAIAGRSCRREVFTASGFRWHPDDGRRRAGNRNKDDLWATAGTCSQPSRAGAGGQVARREQPFAPTTPREYALS